MSPAPIRFMNRRSVRDRLPPDSDPASRIASKQGLPEGAVDLKVVEKLWRAE